MTPSSHVQRAAPRELDAAGELVVLGRQAGRRERAAARAFGLAIAAPFVIGLAVGAEEGLALCVGFLEAIRIELGEVAFGDLHQELEAGARLAAQLFAAQALRGGVGV